jgi:hypothetical protein
MVGTIAATHAKPLVNFMAASVHLRGLLTSVAITPSPIVQFYAPNPLRLILLIKIESIATEEISVIGSVLKEFVGDTTALRNYTQDFEFSYFSTR